MKINVDAAILKNSSKASASAVARDSSGMFVGASVMVTEGISDPEIMEAVACRESLALASDLMLQKFRVACDNITVVRNIRDKGFGPYGHVIQEIRHEEQVSLQLSFSMKVGCLMGMLIG
jgi:ribonuclease HI